MLEKILEYERNLFFFLHGHHTTFWDCFMWLYSGMFVWIPLIVILLFCFIYKQKWQEWLTFLASAILLILLCDLLTSHFSKPFFARFRPTHHPAFMNDIQVVFGYVSDNYGFMSGHSANSFGFALFSSLVFRYRPYTFVIFAWATIMAYSRIYLGVHFVSDIVPGAIFGAVFGFLVYRLYLYIRKRTLHTTVSLREVSGYSTPRKKIITYTTALYVLTFTALSIPLARLLA